MELVLTHLPPNSSEALLPGCSEVPSGKWSQEQTPAPDGP